MNNEHLIPPIVMDLIEKYQKLEKKDSERMNLEARLLAIQSKLEKVLPRDRYKKSSIQ